MTPHRPPTPGNDVELRAGSLLDRYTWDPEFEAWRDSQGAYWWAHDFHELQAMLENRAARSNSKGA
jgi:hypothetical protein